MSINYKAMGERIREKRKEKKLTQEKLAEKIDISTSHVGEIERGTGVCSLDVLDKIAKVLEMNLDTLVNGINDTNAGSAFAEILEQLPKDSRNMYIKICENIADSFK